MFMPSHRLPARRLVRPTLWIAGGGLALAGAALAWLVHPAWAILTVAAGLALIFVPDPASSSDVRNRESSPCCRS